MVIASGIAAGAIVGATNSAPIKGWAEPGQINTQVPSIREISFALLSDDLAKIQPLLDEYGAANNVTFRTDPNSHDDLYVKLNINLTQSTAAYDLVSMEDPWLPLFAGGKLLEDIGEMMDKRGVPPDPDVIPALMALGEFPTGSGLRALPWVGNVQAFAWRTDLLSSRRQEVPRTWDEVLVLASAITSDGKADNLFGIGVQGQAGRAAATSFLPVLRGFGKDLLDPETNEPQLETPEAMAALDLHLKLAKQAPPGVEDVGSTQNGDNFSSGRIAMSGDIWPGQLLQAIDPRHSAVVDKIAVGPEPAQPNVVPVNTTENWLLGIPTGAANAELALDFMLWFTAPEQQRRLLLNSGVMPTRASVMTDAEAIAKFPFLPGYLDAARHGVPRVRTPYYPALELIYGRYVSEVIAGKTDAQDAMANANKEIRNILVREGVIT
ncbi:MAG TPA: extracellular solute-binding protein [Thermomicrobiales bacterium]|nr:extracellular solute-binding protein [Thermomicrobiales bacterium]